MEAESLSFEVVLGAISIALLPLFSFLLLIFLKNTIAKKQLIWLGAWLQGLTLLGTLWVFITILQSGEPQIVQIDWFNIKTYSFTISIFIDNTTAFMLLVVNLISLLVHIFSLEYMKKDPEIVRYFAYLGLFTFAMLGILLTSNLLVIYIFWELVGLSSYLLIGFWHNKIAARRAAKKAFILNRIGDAGFLIGICCIYIVFSTLDLRQISQVFQSEIIQNNHLLLLAGFGIFCGAMGKSAQLPLSTWLPDAMEGPTPVSALIHAATMVAAGVYLLFRCAFLFLPDINLLIAIIGITTAFAAAFAALSQTDIKKVLAYSTISQLGYMVCAIGIGNPESGMFHLFTHAFFKAGLFLSTGAVIHLLHQAAHQQHIEIDAQDMQHMGGLFKKSPILAVCFVICGCALAGLPFFSGFLSKDAILLSMWQFATEQSASSHNNAYWLFPIVGFITALLTAFYVSRQVFLVFGGSWRGNSKIWEHVPKLNGYITLPIIILSLFSFFLFFSFNPFDKTGSWVFAILPKSTHTSNAGHTFIAITSALLAILGTLTAWLIFQQEKGSTLKNIFKTNNLFYDLSFHFWYIDALLVKSGKRGLLYTSQFLVRTDRKILDAIIDNFAILQVVVAHILAWTDKNIVDGFIRIFTKSIQLVANVLRKSPGKQVQSYVSWAVFTTLLIILMAVLYL